MSTLFYLSSIIFFYQELKWLFSPIEQTEDTKKFKQLSDKNKGRKWDEFTEDYKSALKSKIWLLFTLFWLFSGLFTFQWTAFLLILLFNLFIIAPLSRLTKYSFVYTVIHWINSLIGFSFCVFVIVNKYHLHINITEYFFRLFK